MAAKPVTRPKPYLTMTTRTRFPLAAFVALLPLASLAQDADDEDVFELSPFMVSSSESNGYRATSSIAGTKTNTEISLPISDSGATIIGVPAGSYTDLSNATGVKIEFAVGFYDDEEEVRRKTLNHYLDQIREEIAKRPDLRFEPGAVRVPRGDKKWSRGKKRSEYTSYAHFFVAFPLPIEESPFEKVRSIRRLIGNLGLDGDVTRVFYGNATLESHRLSDYPKVLDFNAAIQGLIDELGQPFPLQSPSVPITLIKKADAIALSVSIQSYHELEQEREQILMDAIAALREQVESDSQQKLEIDRILIGPSDRSDTSGKPQVAHTALAEIRIIVDLANNQSPSEQLWRLNQSIRALDAESPSFEVKYEPAKMLVRNPERHRAELIASIHADIDALQKAMGENYKLVPTLSNERLRLSQFSSTEVEFWLPYTYQTISLEEKELERQKLMLEHARAMAQATRPLCPHGNPVRP